MKAMVHESYGPPSVLRLVDEPTPIPKDDELRVQIRAASVNALDWHFLRGTPLPMRAQFGWRKPKNRILGCDFAGTVDAIGKDVTRFQPGDDVFGALGFGLGAFAEYACVGQDEVVVHKPQNTSFEEAAAVPAAGLTALMGLRERGHIQPGQRVLINGASGGVGTFSVQIAKAFGATVTGVCGTENVELVRSLGADEVIDYNHEDFTACGKVFDLILDNVGNRSFPELRRVLSPSGTCVGVGFSTTKRQLMQALHAPLLSRPGGQRFSASDSSTPQKAQLEFLKDLLEAGKLRPSIDRRYPLKQLPDALAYVDQGHAHAKVVVTIGAE